MEIKIVSEEPRIFRGPSPQTGQDWAQLKALGVKYTLDLQSGSGLMKDGSPLDEQLAADDWGIKAYCHPLGEFLPPTVHELDLAVELMSCNSPIYVHCKAGVDRTGMVIAHYRILAQSWAREKAIAEMWAMGMHPWYFYWAWTLK